MPAFFTPTLAQVVAVAVNRHGCVLETIDVREAIGGARITVSYLSREVGGEPLEAILPNIQQHERLTPEKLREIVADLRIPIEEFYRLDPF